MYAGRGDFYSKTFHAAGAGICDNLIDIAEVYTVRKVRLVDVADAQNR